MFRINAHSPYTLSLGIIFFSITVKLYLSILYPSYLNPQEVERYYFSESIPQLLSENSNDILTYAKNQGHTLFPLSLIYLFPFSQIFGPRVFELKIPHTILLFILSVLLFNLLIKMSKAGKAGFVFIAILIAVSPWPTVLAYQHLPETLSLIFVLVLYGLLSRLKNLSFSESLVLWMGFTGSALSSMSGLIFSLGLSAIFIYILFSGLNPKKTSTSAAGFPLLIFITVVVFIISLNKTYIFNTLKHNTFIEKVRPSVLTQEINERQKVDFLAMNKNFILPGILRKAIYNKPVVAFSKTLIQAVSIADFEHFAFPLESYDQLRLSGILPKGNLPLLYFFEIPLMILGIFVMNKGKKLSMVLCFITASLIPFIIFEKRDLVYTGVFFIPVFYLAESYAFLFLYPRFLSLGRPAKYLIFAGVLILIVASVVNFYSFFYTKQLSYKRSDVYAFKEISIWYIENKDKYKNFVITDRFGPAHMMSAFHADLPPVYFWNSYLHPEIFTDGQKVKIQNLEFRQIAWKGESVKPDTVYIGFPGEFSQPSETIDTEKPPQKTELLKEIIFEDELVFNYGKKIWIIKNND